MLFIGSSIAQGILWAIMALGVYVTFRLLDIADLSCEGVFPLGAAVCARLIANGVDPWIATFVALVSGMAAGWIAGFLNTVMKIPPLLTGILVLTGMYSINLHIMSQPNIALLGKKTLMSLLLLSSLSTSMKTAVVGSIVFVLVVLLMSWFLHTEVGLGFRAIGDNVIMGKANGINSNRMVVLGYILGNGLIALAGALIAQKDGFADINMGIGTIVIGLSAVMISEVVVPNLTIGKRLASIVIGSIIYRVIIDTILNQPFIAIAPTDLRLYSAILLALVLWFPKWREQRK